MSRVKSGQGISRGEHMGRMVRLPLDQNGGSRYSPTRFHKWEGQYIVLRSIHSNLYARHVVGQKQLIFDTDEEIARNSRCCYFELFDVSPIRDGFTRTQLMRFSLRTTDNLVLTLEGQHVIVHPPTPFHHPILFITEVPVPVCASPGVWCIRKTGLATTEPGFPYNFFFVAEDASLQLDEGSAGESWNPDFWATQHIFTWATVPLLKAISQKPSPSSSSSSCRSAPFSSPSHPPDSYLSYPSSEHKTVKPTVARLSEPLHPPNTCAQPLPADMPLHTDHPTSCDMPPPVYAHPPPSRHGYSGPGYERGYGNGYEAGYVACTTRKTSSRRLPRHKEPSFIESKQEKQEEYDEEDKSEDVKEEEEEEEEERGEEGKSSRRNRRRRIQGRREEVDLPKGLTIRKIQEVIVPKEDQRELEPTAEHPGEMEHVLCKPVLILVGVLILFFLLKRH